MVLEYRKVSKKNISNSFRGILRVSPDNLEQDTGISDTDKLYQVSDSIGNACSLWLGQNEINVHNLVASGNTLLSGKTDISGKSFTIHTDRFDINTSDKSFNLNGITFDLSDKPTEGDILFYQNKKFTPLDLEQYILNVIRRNNESLIGHIMIWPSQTIPDKWLLCDGTILERKKYSNLFDVLGHIFVKEEHDQNWLDQYFQLPDFRGMFPRGYNSFNEPHKVWDTQTIKYGDKYNNSRTTRAERIIDKGRLFGSYQLAAIPNIFGQVLGVSESFQNGIATDCFAKLYPNSYTAYTPHHVDASGTGNFEFNAGFKNIMYQDVKEVRPDNISINFIIKY